MEFMGFVNVPHTHTHTHTHMSTKCTFSPKVFAARRNVGKCHIEGLSSWVVPSAFAKISLESKANKGRQSHPHENFCKLSFTDYQPDIVTSNKCENKRNRGGSTTETEQGQCHTFLKLSIRSVQSIPELLP